MAYGVGTVNVDVAPSLKGFHSKLAAEVGKLADLKVNVTPDTAGFTKGIKGIGDQALKGVTDSASRAGQSIASSIGGGVSRATSSLSMLDGRSLGLLSVSAANAGSTISSAIGRGAASAKGHIGGISGAFSRIGSVAGSAGASIRKSISGSLQEARKHADGLPPILGKISGALAVVAGPMAILKAGWGRAAGFQDAEVRFKSIGVTGQKFTDTMSMLNGVVKGTSAGLDEAASQASMLMTSGVKGGADLQHTMEALVTASAVGGRSVSDLGMVFQQVAAAGKLQAGDALQLSQASIPIWSWLAKSMGKSVEEVRDMSEKGKISYEDMIKAIRENGGSLAKDMSQTFGGQVSLLKSSMARLGEVFAKPLMDLGGRVLPILTKAFDAVKTPLKSFFDWLSGGSIAAEVVKTALMGIGSAVVVGGIVAVVGALGTMSEMLGLLSGAWSALVAFTPVGLLIAGIVAIIAAFTMLWKHSEGFRNFWIGLWDNIKSAASNVGDAIMQAVGPAIDWVKNTVSGLGDTFTDTKNRVSELWDAFSGSIGGSILIEALVDIFSRLWDGVKNLAEAYGQLVLSLASSAWDMLVAVLKAVWDALTALWQALAPVLLPILKAVAIVVGVILYVAFMAILGVLWLLSAAFQGVATAINWVVQNVFTPLLQVITTIATAILNFVTWLVGGIATFAATIIGYIEQFIVGLVDLLSGNGETLKNLWITIWNDIKNVFAPVAEFIKNVWSAVTAWLSQKAQEIWQAITAKFNAVRDSVVGAVSSMWESTKSAFSSGVAAVVGFVSSLPGRIKGFFASAGSWLVGAGRSIMQGLMNGISSMVGAVVGKVKAIGSRIKSAFTGLLGIHSPSRVFMGYGQYLVEGLAAGVDDKAQVAVSSASQLAATTDSALEASLPTSKTIAPDITAEAGTPVVAGGVGAATVMGQEMQRAQRAMIEPAASGITTAVQQMGATVAGVMVGQAGGAMLQLAATTGATAMSVRQATVGNMAPAFAQTGQSMLFTQQSQVEPALAATRESVTQTAATFGPAASMIGAQWSRVRPATAEPVRYAINSVFNGGLVGMWNSVSDLLGTRKMSPYVARFATGGYVAGPGGPTDDKIPAMLSNGEYVINADTVRKVGVGALDRLNAGAHRYPGVVHGRAGDEMYNDLTFQNVALRRQGGGIAEGTPAWEALKRAHIFAQRWSPRPYVWGGSLGANNGTDCSGWMSSIADVILGGNGMQRKWATGSFPGPQRGAWKQGLAAGFSVGISNVHTAGTLTGVAGFPTVNVESGGNTGQGPTYGGRAVGADHPQFPRKYSLIITDGGAFIPGGGGSAMSMGEMVGAMMKPAKDKLAATVKAFVGQGIVGGVPAAVASTLGDAIVKKTKTIADNLGGGPIPDGAGAERWRPMAMRAMARVGFNANDKRQVDAMIAQIRTESGGNAGVAQQIHDVNGTGESAGVGLLQIIPGTFAAHRDPALPNNRRDPFANMVAALRYYKSRYGNDLTTMWGHGHGYDMGGWLAPGMNATYNGFAKPEAVLTPAESEAFVGVARMFSDDQRAGASYTGQHVENQWVVDPDELTWRTERGVRRAMREESIRV